MFALAISIAVFAFSNVARAQNYPECAHGCFHSLIDQSDCAKSDIACLCRDTNFVEASAKCILSSCPHDQSEIAIRDAKGWCAAKGTSISVPSVTSPLSSSTGSGSTTFTASTTSVSVGTNSPSTTLSATPPAQTSIKAASQNSNGAIPQNANIVAGVVAFGLVVLAL